MSAFVVNDKTINQILSFLSTDRDSDWMRRELGKLIGSNLDRDTDWSKLGHQMFALNCEAVNQRYGSDHEAEQFRTLDYKYRFELPHKMQAYARLKCWLYQCSEGDVPETPLYKAMQQVQYWLADSIVSRSPQYESAGWEAQ